MFSHVVDESRVRQTCVLVGGALPQIEAALGTTAPGFPLLRPLASRAPGAPYHELEALVDVLISRRKWVPAFEVSLAFVPVRIPDVVEQATNALLEAGEFDRLWRMAERVPKWLRRNDAVLHSVFSAAIAVNQWQGLLGDVDAHLANHEAPRLRGLRAMLQPQSSSHTEAERAYAAEPCAETARALGFTEALVGRTDRALDLLRESMAMAEREGRPRILVAAANSAALANIRAGSYRSAQYWASWALRRFQGFGLQEELLRLSVVNLSAYSRLLSGSLAGAQQVLGVDTVDRKLAGIPGMEGILSTLGDVELVRGAADAALTYYQMILDKATTPMMSIAVNDVVKALCIGGRESDAIELALETFELCRGMGGFQASVAALALGTALMAGGDLEAESVLHDAHEALLAHSFGPLTAQAAIELAWVRKERGNEAGARETLRAANHCIAELSDSGWRLLGAVCDAGPTTMALWAHDPSDVYIQLLGARRMRIDGVTTALSLRNAELLAVLAQHPAGLRGEEAADVLYGEHARLGTFKALVSRARRVVPIDAPPYRIGRPFEADFMEVLKSLESGHLERALDIYRGPLLPESEAPAVVEAREHLEESLRQAVLASRDAEALIHLATRSDGDLELWEEASRWLSSNDPRRPLVNARIRRIRQSWA